MILSLADVHGLLVQYYDDIDILENNSSMSAEEGKEYQ